MSHLGYFLDVDKALAATSGQAQQTLEQSSVPFSPSNISLNIISVWCQGLGWDSSKNTLLYVDISSELYSGQWTTSSGTDHGNESLSS